MIPSDDVGVQRSVLRVALSLLLVFIAPSAGINAQSVEPDTAGKVNFGGYVDTYYAFDFNRPTAHDRAFTTQAARHNEFNINLAFLEATLNARRLRGRVAAQFGTSVQANYSSEPKLGALSGPDVSRFVQEATFGYQVTPRIWIDAGVFLSSFGSENWTSRDNWTYTRSLVAENSPYYESGIKGTWRVSQSLVAQMHFINGWQNISENNAGKAVGVRLDYSRSSTLALSYDAFVGNEAADSVAGSRRVWHEGVLTIAPSGRLQIRGTLDYGVQRNRSLGTSSWWGYSLIGHYAVTPKLAGALRTERYEDPDQVIVATGLPYGFRASGRSINVDITPLPRLLWRLELRELVGRRPLFPAAPTGMLARRDRLVVASAALTF